MVVRPGAIHRKRELVMDLRFIGIDPETKSGGSPTVWVRESTADLVIQGVRAGGELRRTVREAEWATGHESSIPSHETVIVVPARLVPALREAGDVAERARLRGAAPRGGADGRPPGDA